MVSRALGKLSRGIGQPLVIAEIVAGILLGPSLLGRLWPEAYAAIFPADSVKVLALVSQLGLVLFMFLVGLEFDPKLLKGRTHSSIAISHSSIIVPFALGAGLAVTMGDRLGGETSARPLAFALFMGIAMSITAFPVLARILTDQRMLKTRVGGIALTCAAVDDVTAWCLLAFVVAITRSRGLESALITTALALAYIGVMFWLVRPLLSRLSARANRAEALTSNMIALVVLLLLVSALVTEAIGIHALFGAFLLGVILPKDGNLPTALAHRLEEVVLVVLLPLFFACSGVRTQIGLVSTAADWAMCGLIILLASVGKFGASTLAARITGVEWREAVGIGVLMNTRGLMELIVLNIGLDLGVIGPKLFTMMVIMALVTTFITTPLIQWLFPPADVTRSLTKAAVPETLASTQPGYSVLICVADERVGPSLATLARALSAREQDQIYALSLSPPADRGVLSERSPQPTSPLAPLLARAAELSLPVQSLSFVSASPPEDIRAVAEDRRASLVLLGSHKPLVGKSLLGGVVRAVMRGASSDTGVLIDRGLSRVERVLVPFVGNAHDLSALATARRLVESSGARLTLLELREKGQEKPNPALLGLLAWVDGQTAVTRKLADASNPIDAIVAELREGYDLMLVGAGKDLGLEPILGVQREQLLSACDVSVLVVRAAATASPAPASAPTSAHMLI